MRASTWLNRASRLRLLILSVSDRCDQRCVHCQIWSGDGGPLLSREERLHVVEEALSAGIEQALLTGGEPLLAADLWPIAERLRARGVRTMLATNGMLLARYADRVAGLFDEVYVSLDGASPATHDGVRGVAAFDRVAEGVGALLAQAPRPRIVARSTLHGRNLHELEAIVEATARLGFDHVSFLPLDASSEAFGSQPALRRALLPLPAQMRAFEQAVGRLEAAGRLGDGFVVESAAKLHRVGHHLAASAGEGSFERPACDAPWWSVVVEADGQVRPCFFHEAVGAVAPAGLAALRNGAAYRTALGRIRGDNPTCQRCVCPKYRGGWPSLLRSAS